MQRTPALPASPWNVMTLVAVGFAAAAVAMALAAFLSVARAQRLADDVLEQRSITLAHEDRALFCLDRAAARLNDPAAALSAERSLNISGGITLCLVAARDNARVDAAALGACVRRLEAANLVPADGWAAPRPAC